MPAGDVGEALRSVAEADGTEGNRERAGRTEGVGFLLRAGIGQVPRQLSGGLLKHSLNVYDEAMLVRDAQLGLKPDIAARLPTDSIAIVALLHDICKAEVYKEMEKFRKDKYGQ